MDSSNIISGGTLQFARGNLKLSEVLCESQYTILYKASAEGIRDNNKPMDVSVKALRGQCTLTPYMRY